MHQAAMGSDVATMLFAFMLFLGDPVSALNANGLRNKLVEIPQPTPLPHRLTLLMA
jgi:hypothetical protein